MNTFNRTPENQLAFAYRGMWIWRAVVVILLLFFSIIYVMGYWESHLHYKAEAATEAEVRRVIGIINKNYDQTVRTQEALEHCGSCHQHAKPIDLGKIK